MLPPGMVLAWLREESATSCTQDFALKNPGNPYSMICDRPKIAALKKEFPDLFVSYKGQHTETIMRTSPGKLPGMANRAGGSDSMVTGRHHLPASRSHGSAISRGEA